MQQADWICNASSSLSDQGDQSVGFATHMQRNKSIFSTNTNHARRQKINELLGMALRELQSDQHVRGLYFVHKTLHGLSRG